LSGVHDVFHISQLRRYVRDDSHVLDYSRLTVRPDMSYKAQPTTIVD
jgi:hypothetical protein